MKTLARILAWLILPFFYVTRWWRERNFVSPPVSIAVIVFVTEQDFPRRTVATVTWTDGTTDEYFSARPDSAFVWKSMQTGHELPFSSVLAETLAAEWSTRDALRQAAELRERMNSESQ